MQIDKSKCIGCQFCAMSCPYGVRYLNEEERVVEKCTLCEQKIAQGELPQCVSQCCGMARWFGDADEGIEGFVGPRGEILGEYISPFSDDQVYSLPDVGNKPSLRYISVSYTHLDVYKRQSVFPKVSLTLVSYFDSTFVWSYTIKIKI